MARVRRFLRLSILFFRDLFLKNKVCINATVYFKRNKFCTCNYGDDLNYTFLKEIIDGNIVIYSRSVFFKFFKKNNYLCIGSTIEMLGTSNTIVWGAGCISENLPVPKLKQVLAVRGPLTRKRLLESGIYCPEIYGDPALILPLFYKPHNVHKRYTIGIIPHYVDKNNSFILEMSKNNSVLVIDLQCYFNWRSIIDQIMECEFIISSSLHGLIISDAYSIPNIWVEFSDKIKGNRFKYYDYYYSIGRNSIEPLKIDRIFPIEELFRLSSSWVSPKIDIQVLLDACPFKINSVLK